MRGPGNSQQRDDDKCPEEWPLIKQWQDDERSDRRRTGEALAVDDSNFKPVVPGWNIRVVRHPARLRVRPVGVETVEFVMKAQLVRRLERRTRVMKLERAMTRRHLGTGSKPGVIDVDLGDVCRTDRSAEECAFG